MTATTTSLTADLEDLLQKAVGKPPAPPAGKKSHRASDSASDADPAADSDPEEEELGEPEDAPRKLWLQGADGVPVPADWHPHSRRLRVRYEDYGQFDSPEARETVQKALGGIPVGELGRDALRASQWLWRPFLKGYDPGEPRDEAGRWSESGHSAELMRLREEIIEDHPGLRLYAHIETRSGASVLNIPEIVVPKGQRGSGVGTSVMKRLLQFADERGIRTTLSPSSDFGGSKSRLLEFYSRLGFKPNRGRNKDFSISETMIRDPSRSEIRKNVDTTGTTSGSQHLSAEEMKTLHLTWITAHPNGPGTDPAVPLIVHDNGDHYVVVGGAHGQLNQMVLPKGGEKSALKKQASTKKKEQQEAFKQNDPEAFTKLQDAAKIYKAKAKEALSAHVESALKQLGGSMEEIKQAARDEALKEAKENDPNASPEELEKFAGQAEKAAESQAKGAVESALQTALDAVAKAQINQEAVTAQDVEVVVGEKKLVKTLSPEELQSLVSSAATVDKLKQAAAAVKKALATGKTDLLPGLDALIEETAPTEAETQQWLKDGYLQREAVKRQASLVIESQLASPGTQRKHQALGASDSLNSLSALLTGSSCLAPETVQYLGVEASARVLAAHLAAKGHDPAKLAEQLGTRMRERSDLHVAAVLRLSSEMDALSQAAEDAAAKGDGTVTWSQALILRENQAARKFSLLNVCRGQLQAASSLYWHLTHPSKKPLTLPGGESEVATRIKAKSLGLAEGDYELKGTEDKKGFQLVVKPEAIGKLVQPASPAQGERTRRVAEIKQEAEQGGAGSWQPSEGWQDGTGEPGPDGKTWKVDLAPHQIAAARTIVELGSAVGNLGAGSGKTFVMHAAASELLATGKVKRGLISMPPKPRAQQDGPTGELSKCLKGEMRDRFAVVKNGAHLDKLLAENPDRVLIMSPEMMRDRAEQLKGAGFGSPESFTFCDEAQDLVTGITEGEGSGKANAARDLVGGSGYKFLGSGTLMANDACIHAETLIEDPLLDEVRTVRDWMESGIAPHVWALSHGREVVVAQASVPFVKSYGPMFRVVLESGREIVVAPGHRFLTPTGWGELRGLVPGCSVAISPCVDPMPREGGRGVDPRIGDLATLPWYALRSTDRDGDFRGDYRFSPCFGGERLLPKAGIDPGVLPSPAGAHARSQTCLPGGDQWTSPTRNRLERSSARPSISSDSTRPAAPVGTLTCGRGVCRSSGNIAAPFRGKRRAAPQPTSASCRQQSSRESSGRASIRGIHPGEASCIVLRHNDTSEWDRIASIAPDGDAYVYDLEVPEHHNYLAHGIWNHNSEVYDALSMVDSQAFPDSGKKAFSERWERQAMQGKEAALGGEQLGALQNEVGGYMLHYHQDPTGPDGKPVSLTSSEQVLPLGDEQKAKIVAANEQRAKDEVDPNPDVRAAAALRWNGSVMRACIGPPMFDHISDYVGERRKKDPGYKAVVWSQELLPIGELEGRLGKHGKVVTITGAHGDKETKAAIDQFQNDPDVCAVVISNAANFGVNLQAGQSVLKCGFPPVPSKDRQLDARIFRRGQDKDVETITYLSDNPLVKAAYANAKKIKGSQLDLMASLSDDSLLGQIQSQYASDLAKALGDLLQSLIG